MTQFLGTITAPSFCRVVPPNVTAEMPCACPALRFVIAPLHQHDRCDRLIAGSLTARASTPKPLGTLALDSPKVERRAASYSTEIQRP
jgi:hypothetical protein